MITPSTNFRPIFVGDLIDFLCLLKPILARAIVDRVIKKVLKQLSSFCASSGLPSTALAEDGQSLWLVEQDSAPDISA